MITGPRTQLNWPTGLFVDSDREELYVANDGGNSILVFSTDANGDAAPIRVLKGPKTQLSYPSSVFVDVKNDEIFVANFGNHRVTVYPRRPRETSLPSGRFGALRKVSPHRALANVRHRLRHQAGTDPGPQLSGPSADCDIRQAGEWKRADGSQDRRPENDVGSDATLDLLRRDP